MQSFGGGGRFAVALVLPLALTVMMMMPSSSDAEQMHIENRMAYGLSFKIHCRSADDDLQERTVVPGGDYSWEFRTNIFGSTLFYCDIWWGAGLKFSFVAYDAANDGRDKCVLKNRIFLCWWVNTEYALYNWNQKDRVWDIVHFWEA